MHTCLSGKHSGEKGQINLRCRCFLDVVCPRTAVMTSDILKAGISLYLQTSSVFLNTLNKLKSKWENVYFYLWNCFSLFFCLLTGRHFVFHYWAASVSTLIFILNRHLVQTFPTFDIFCLACFPLTLVFIEELFQYIKPYSLTMSCKF